MLLGIANTIVDNSIPQHLQLTYSFIWEDQYLDYTNFRKHILGSSDELLEIWLKENVRDYIND